MAMAEEICEGTKGSADEKQLYHKKFLVLFVTEPHLRLLLAQTRALQCCVDGGSEPGIFDAWICPCSSGLRY